VAAHLHLRSRNLAFSRNDGLHLLNLVPYLRLDGSWTRSLMELRVCDSVYQFFAVKTVIGFTTFVLGLEPAS